MASFIFFLAVFGCTQEHLHDASGYMLVPYLSAAAGAHCHNMHPFMVQSSTDISLRSQKRCRVLPVNKVCYSEHLLHEELTTKAQVSKKQSAKCWAQRVFANQMPRHLPCECLSLRINLSGIIELHLEHWQSETNIPV